MFGKNTAQNKRQVNKLVLSAKTVPLFRGAFTGGAYEQAIKLSKQIEEKEKKLHGRTTKV